MNNQDANNESIITDLNVNEETAAETDAKTFTDDLLVSAEQQNAVRGGCNPLFSACGPIGNHNETVAADDAEDHDAETDQLTDLAVSEEQTDEVKGGPGPGGVWLNHNETVAADETPGASLADLTAQNADEIKGGPKRIFIGGLSVNEAPSALLDLEPSGEVKGGMQYRAKRSE